MSHPRCVFWEVRRAGSRDCTPAAGERRLLVARFMRAIGILCVLFCGCGDSDPVVEPLEESWRRILGNDVDLLAPHPFVFDRDGNFVFALHLREADCFELRKLGPDGAEVWRKLFTDPPPVPLRCPQEAAPAVDGQGNIFVLDRSSSGSSPVPRTALFLRKYNPQGDVLWTRYHEGGTIDPNHGHAMATDRAGNLIAGGAGVRDMGADVPLLAEYSPDGMLLWVHDTDPIAGSWIAAETDGADNVLALRELDNAGGTSRGLELHKLDPGGNPIWHVALSPPSDRWGPSLAVHPDGWSVVTLGSNQLIAFDADGRSAFELEVAPRLRTVDEAEVIADLQYAAIAVDGTIAVSSAAVTTRCTIDPTCQEPAILISRYTPEGALISRGLLERRTNDRSRRVTIDSFAFDSRGRLAFTGNDQDQAFVAAIDPQ